MNPFDLAMLSGRQARHETTSILKPRPEELVGRVRQSTAYSCDLRLFFSLDISSQFGQLCTKHSRSNSTVVANAQWIAKTCSLHTPTRNSANATHTCSGHGAHGCVPSWRVDIPAEATSPQVRFSSRACGALNIFSDLLAAFASTPPKRMTSHPSP